MGGGHAAVLTASITTASRPLLVGETNPYGHNPRCALAILPRGAAGDRLRVILGLSDMNYLRLFDRTNLCVGEWNLRAARAAADRIKLLRDERGRWHPVILLGAKVCRAFKIPFKPFAWFAERLTGGAVYVVLPHPSGRCRLWNERGAARKARRAVGAVVDLRSPC